MKEVFIELRGSGRMILCGKLSGPDSF